MKTKTKPAKKTTTAKTTTLKVGLRRAFLGTKLRQSPYGERGNFVDACEYLADYVHADHAVSLAMLVRDAEGAALLMQLVLANAAHWGFVHANPLGGIGVDWKALYDAVANAWGRYDTHASLAMASAAIDHDIDTRFGPKDRFGHREKHGVNAGGGGLLRLETMSLYLRALTHACFAECEPMVPPVSERAAE